MKHKQKIFAVLLIFSLSFGISKTSAFQDEDKGVEMVDGFKMKTTKNRETKLVSDVKIDENSNSGSVSIGFSNDVTKLIHWCKTRKNKSQ